MSEILNKLSQVNNVTEWIDPHDARLEAVTGELAPNSGSDVREEWACEETEFAVVAEAVKRVLVPPETRPRVMAKFAGDMDWNRVDLLLADARDLSTCFPVNARTHIFDRRDGNKVWAAVALCGRVLGLAVFASEENKDGGKGALMKVQPVPEEVFAQLIG